MTLSSREPSVESLLRLSLENDDNELKLKKDTNKDPLGNILLEICSRHNDLCKKLGSTHIIDGNNLCKNFIEKIKDNDSQINKAIDEGKNEIVNNIEKQIISKELNYLNNSQNVLPPTKFAEENADNNISRVNEATKIFPIRRRFDGTSQNIVEHLSEINHSQQIVNLSKSEFKIIFKKCFTKTPFDIVTNLILLDYPLQDIYFTLISQFDTRLSINEARQELNTFTCTKNLKIIEVISKIIHLATRIASELPPGKSQIDVYNIECKNALIRSLPSNSAQIVTNQYNLLSSKLDRTPSFIELCKSLLPYHSSINTDIKNNGATHQKSTLTQDRFKNWRPYRAKPQVYQLDYKGKKYCSLCGGSSHNASETCYKMKTDSNKIVEVIPTFDPCKTCLSRLDKKLYHPDKFCFLRPTYPKNRAFITKKKEN